MKVTFFYLRFPVINQIVTLVENDFDGFGLAMDWSFLQI